MISAFHARMMVMNATFRQMPEGLNATSVRALGLFGRHQ
ncbi:hypothetical protein SEA_CECE_167 [Microbacterium phage Cece]|nr:hypothetical protein SEA_CECE_167 [Microbacterium phage Cece]